MSTTHFISQKSDSGFFKNDVVINKTTLKTKMRLYYKKTIKTDHKIDLQSVLNCKTGQIYAKETPAMKTFLEETLPACEFDYVLYGQACGGVYPSDYDGEHVVKNKAGKLVTFKIGGEDASAIVMTNEDDDTKFLLQGIDPNYDEDAEDYF